MLKMSERLNYNLDNLEDRKKLVNNIAEEYGEEFGCYFTEKFNPHLKKTSLTSESNSVCNDLEKVADYLIYAKDKEDREREKEGKQKDRSDIITESKKTRNKRREVKMSKQADYDSFNGEQKVRYSKPQFRVTKQDRKEFKELEETGKAIKNLSKMIKTKKTLSGEEISDTEVKRLKWIRTDIQKDELAVKNSLKKYVSFNSVTRTERDDSALSFVRFDDIETVKVLLNYYHEFKKNSKNDTFGYLKLVMMSFDNIIDNCEFDEETLEILDANAHGLKQKEIIDLVLSKFGKEYSRFQISKIVSKVIPEKIVETYKGMKEDWAYTYFLKGSYKTCNICSQVKLATNKNFPTRENGQLRDTCKSCVKSKSK